MAFSYKKTDPKKDEDVVSTKKTLDSNSTYKKSDSVVQAETERDTHANNKVSDWTGGTYGTKVNEYLDKIANRESFSYDLNADALYQQYKDQYITAGQTAMMDAIGQAAAMSGGYGNSYAASVGNQAYQSYLQQLNDKIPELYSLALSKYEMEGDQLQNTLTNYQNAYNTEYNEYRDKVSDWQTEQSRLDTNAYNLANLDFSQFESNRNYYSSLYDTALNYAVNQSNTNYENAWNQYLQDYTETRDAVADEQWQKEYDLSVSQNDQSDTISSLQSQISSLTSEGNYYKALYTLKDGIQLDSGQGNNKRFTVLGKTYKTREAAENAVAEYLDSLGIEGEQANSIFDYLGIGTYK